MCHIQAGYRMSEYMEYQRFDLNNWLMYARTIGYMTQMYWETTQTKSRIGSTDRRWFNTRKIFDIQMATRDIGTRGFLTFISWLPISLAVPIWKSKIFLVLLSSLWHWSGDEEYWQSRIMKWILSWDGTSLLVLKREKIKFGGLGNLPHAVYVGPKKSSFSLSGPKKWC